MRRTFVSVEPAREAAKRGRWQHYGIRDRGYIGMETESDRVLELSLLFVPGLLQTEAYLRELRQRGWQRQLRRTSRNPRCCA